MTDGAKISIAFTADEIEWLAWVIKDVMSGGLDEPGATALFEHASPEMRSACDKIITAEQLFNGIEGVINERTKVRKVDTRKRQAPGPRRKSSRGRSSNT